MVNSLRAEHRHIRPIHRRTETCESTTKHTVEATNRQHAKKVVFVTEAIAGYLGYAGLPLM